jgi:hypothetical protein
MCYHISSTTNHHPTKGAKYLLDSNIWIDILTPKNKPPEKQIRYRKFFSNLTKSENNVMIIVPALLISEVFNRILKEVCMKKYIRENKINFKDYIIPGDFYKNTYRPSVHYIASYKKLCDDLLSYANFIEFVNDGFNTSIPYTELLTDLPVSLDFNDFVYYTLAKKNGYFLVTDDKDFWIKDVQIITESSTLLSKMRTYNLNKKKPV